MSCDLLFLAGLWDHMAGVLEEEKGRVGACYSGQSHSIGSNHDGRISQSQMDSRRSLKSLLLLLPSLFDFKRGTLGLVKAAGRGDICVCVCIVHMWTFKRRKWKPCRWNRCTLLYISAPFSNMNQCFWVKKKKIQPHFDEMLLLCGRRHGKAGMANHGWTMAPFHSRPLCTDLCIVGFTPHPLRHSRPASWHGDGSAVDKVHNTPSSPRHNRGTWTQAPLWHTRGWGGDTGASQAGGAANVSVMCW